MTKRFSALIIAAVMGLLVVAIGFGFLIGWSKPVPWILIVVLISLPFLFNKQAEQDILVWKEEYSVGIKMLDDDHKKLIDLLNQFKTAYDYQTSESFERHTLDSLVDYTKLHFAREEKLMEQHNYPDIIEHKKQHAQMIAQVDSFVTKYNELGYEAQEYHRAQPQAVLIIPDLLHLSFHYQQPHLPVIRAVLKQSFILRLHITSQPFYLKPELTHLLLLAHYLNDQLLELSAIHNYPNGRLMFESLPTC